MTNFRMALAVTLSALLVTVPPSLADDESKSVQGGHNGKETPFSSQENTFKKQVSELEEAVKAARGEPVSVSEEALETFLQTLTSEPKVFNVGRIDSGECETRRQTLSVYPDGTYVHVAVHYNHSGGVDDGDDHRLNIRVRAGEDIVHSFTSERFVPRRRERTKQVVGQSDALRQRFNDITHFDGTLQCE